MKKRVLLAIGEPTFSQQLRELLINGDFEVVEDEVFATRYLNDNIVMHTPDIVIINDNYLSSEFENEEDKQAEYLQLIDHWRTNLNHDLRVVYMCVNDHKDPFLSQLVARNVLDIFNKLEIRITDFISQLQNPPHFSNVKKMSIGTLHIEFLEPEDAAASQPTTASESHTVSELHDDEPSKDDVTTTNTEETPKSNKAKELASSTVDKLSDAAGTLTKGTSKLVKTISETLPKNSNGVSEELMLKDLLSIIPEVTPRSHVQASIIGTVLIAVAGTKAHIGSTHTALSIANFLKQSGYKVAVIECNESKDFDRIHAIYEDDSTAISTKERYVSIKGIHFHKYRSDLDLNEIYHFYEYVVIDYGDLGEATGFYEEFKRAHVRLVVTSGDEWHTHWVDQFTREHRIDKEDCYFLIPASSDEKADEFGVLIKYDQVFAVPKQDDPFEPLAETSRLFHTLLGQYIKAPIGSRLVSTKIVILACALCIVATTVVISVFNNL